MIEYKYLMCLLLDHDQKLNDLHLQTKNEPRHASNILVNYTEYTKHMYEVKKKFKIIHAMRVNLLGQAKHDDYRHNFIIITLLRIN